MNDKREAASHRDANHRSRRANERRNNNMLLSVPDFQSDALKSVVDNRNNCAHDLREMTNAAIDDRINEMSGLLRPKLLECVRTNRRDEMSIRKIKRATEYTDEQLIDLVLGDADRDNNFTPLGSDADNIILRRHSDIMAEIREAYQHRREELRDMAKSYIERNHRNNGRFPFWPPDPLDGQPRIHAASREIHIDEHGRLVRRRPPQEGAGQQRERNLNDDGTPQVGTNIELLDAAETFWKCYYLAETQQKNNWNRPMTREDRNGFHSNGLDRINHAGHIPPLPPPLHQPHDAHQLSLQMERDAREAIERALERYRKQTKVASSHTEVDRVFELIPIPLVGQENEGNNEQQRWYNRALRRNQANDAANNPVGGIDNGRRPARMGPENVPLQRRPGWIDLRLAFRRICFAVLTVVAAFICTMLQGAPVDFGDDVVYVNGVEVDRLWFTGLLGPHFTGHHTVGRQTAATRHYDYRVLKEVVGVTTNMEKLLNEVFEDEEMQYEEIPMDCVNDNTISCDGST